MLAPKFDPVRVIVPLPVVTEFKGEEKDGMAASKVNIAPRVPTMAATYTFAVGVARPFFKLKHFKVDPEVQAVVVQAETPM